MSKLIDNNRILEPLSSLLVALLPIVYLVTSVFLILGREVEVWQLPAALFIWLLACRVLHPAAPLWRLLAGAVLVLLGCFFWLLLCERFFDLFYDSRSYQATGFLRLSEGWNPYWDWGCCPVDLLSPTPAHPLLAESYPKAHWVLSGLLIRVTGSLQSAFLVPFLGLAAATVLCWEWLHLEWSDRRSGIRVLACGALVFSPIALSQLFSHYVDGLVASVLLSYFFAVWLFLRRGETRFLVYLLLLAPLAINLKFTVPVYLAVLTPVLLLAVRRSDDGRVWKKLVAGGLLAGLLGIAGAGWNPYVSNTLRHGNPLYPAIGYGGSSSAVADAADPSFTARSIFSKVVISNFSVASPSDPRRPVWAAPLRFRFEPGVDHRFSGFGPAFGAVLILGVLTLLVELLEGLLGASPPLTEGQRKLAVLLSGILLSVVITDAGWWARLAPQLWWIPLLIAIGVRKSWARRLGVAVLLLSLGNSALVAWQTLGNQYEVSQNIHHQLAIPAFSYTTSSSPELFANYSWHLLREERPDLGFVGQCNTPTRAVELPFFPGVLVCREE